ncbi:MAG: A/G-specific adenine glycosylase [Hyphomonadaceae bacterium]|nr:A/G-specific adenine glycosylase [Hyphomonadaceae bacterium]MBC6412097.1 A/G-specific adenine glycosylase [Hyphomonadaceae bacterium]
MKKQMDIHKLRADLLGWYDREGRMLPWRIRPEDRARGVTADPYKVWLSEIMLQQTTIAHGAPYWMRIVDEFPTVTDLADASRDHILAMWAGLGYYARARNLHKCAQIVRDAYGGRFPESEAGLLQLPGIGPYTAATMAAICFDEPTNIVDGNVERVISRMFRVEAPLPKGKSAIRKYAATLVTDDRPGDYGQALMDLGANVCTPKSPHCGMCPWSWACQANRAGVETDYPRRIKKHTLPIRYGAVFILRCGDKVLLERRPDKGLLGGMTGFPGTEWGEVPEAPLRDAPVKAEWTKEPAPVRHVFTHFKLRLDVYVGEIETTSGIDGIWAESSGVGTYALPTVMRKCLKQI